MLRRVYELVSVFAVMNVVAALGVGAYCMATGALDITRLRTAALALQGKSPIAEGAKSKESGEAQGPAKKATATTPAGPVAASPPESEVEAEIAYREGERVKAELAQRLALNNSILLKVESEREAFKRDQETVAQRSKATTEQQKDQGFEAQVKLFDSLSPKVAVQHLVGITDPDEAARLLVALDPDKARKIIESAKKGDELKRMQTILQRVREVAPARSEELAEAKTTGKT